MFSPSGPSPVPPVVLGYRPWDPSFDAIHGSGPGFWLRGTSGQHHVRGGVSEIMFGVGFVSGASLGSSVG